MPENIKNKRNWFEKYNQSILIVLTIIGLFFAGCQLKLSIYQSKYIYLTGIWNDIMKESINLPEFSDKVKTSAYTSAFRGDKRQSYETYARWIGGYIEDLYYNKYKKEEWFFYDPWIDSMLEIHKEWFIDHIQYYENTPKFYKILEKL